MPDDLSLVNPRDWSLFAEQALAAAEKLNDPVAREQTLICAGVFRLLAQGGKAHQRSKPPFSRRAARQLI